MKRVATMKIFSRYEDLTKNTFFKENILLNAMQEKAPTTDDKLLLFKKCFFILINNLFSCLTKNSCIQRILTEIESLNQWPKS